MKKQLLYTLCLSALFSAVHTRTEGSINSTTQLSTTLEQAFFAPASGLHLTPEEMNMLANVTLFMYLESHYILRSHMTSLSDETKHRKEVMEKTCTVCLNYIATHGSPQLKAAMQLLEHNTKSIKKSYLNKYQEELISGERDTFVHAQALQQITANLFGLWYKAIYEGMKKYNYPAHCFKLSFNIDGLIQADALRGDMPTPSSLM